MAAGSLPRVVFFLGPPGSGKGTVCALVSEALRYAHLSAGCLLRASESEAVQRSLRSGHIVPSHITIGVLTQTMKSLGAWSACPASHPRGFLLDGFPRNLENARCWEGDTGRRAETRFVISLECGQQESLSRCLSRSEGASSRSDDEVNIIMKRLAVFESETRPVLELFGERGLLRRVNASKPSLQVFADVARIFEAEG